MTFRASSLHDLRPVSDVVIEPLAEALRRLGVARGRIGYEGQPMSEPASYAAMYVYGAAIADLLVQAAPSANLVDASDFLAQLRATKSTYELSRIRLACAIAALAFTQGARQLQTGVKETEAAAYFRTPLSVEGTGHHETERADGFVSCMSGPHSAEAHGAFARSRSRRLRDGDLVLVHCNSYADGYWTDITRTFCLGTADERQRRMYSAVFAAREAALAAIRPGIRAADVDAAARRVLDAHGFGPQFKHATGHGVGFAAIDHEALPRLHPKSRDVLEAGMVFNVEPAIYEDGYGGVRHCDMVAVTNDGADVLTPFQAKIEELQIRPPSVGASAAALMPGRAMSQGGVDSVHRT